MINATILRLRRASIWPQDFGSRYAQLLELLWQRTDTETSNNSQPRVRSNHSQEALSPTQNSHLTPSRQTQQSPAAAPVTSTSFNPQSDFFSWLDLQAVGDAVSGEQNQMPQPGPSISNSGVGGIQQFLDGATRRGSLAFNANGNGNTANVDNDGEGGDPNNLAWLFDDDLMWPDDEYSSLIF
jgi:hypothetical protein